MAAMRIPAEKFCVAASTFGGIFNTSRDNVPIIIEKAQIDVTPTVPTIPSIFTRIQIILLIKFRKITGQNHWPVIISCLFQGYDIITNITYTSSRSSSLSQRRLPLLRRADAGTAAGSKNLDRLSSVATRANRELEHRDRWQPPGPAQKIILTSNPWPVCCPSRC